MHATEETAGASLWRRVLLGSGAFFFRYRDALFPVVFLALVAVSPPATALGRLMPHRVVDALGFALALTGQLLRILVIGLAYIRRGGLDRRVHADTLVVEGFFAHSRNPLYFGNFLALAGFSLIHDSLLSILVGLTFFAYAYLSIVVAEEDFLGRRFGAAYQDYCRRVPRFVPSLKGISQTFAGMRFDWRRVVRKEYGSTFAGLTAVLVLLVWDDYRLDGGMFAREGLTVVLGLWAPLALGYVLARWLKKSGRLGTGVAESPPQSAG